MSKDYLRLNHRFETQVTWTGYFQQKLLKTLKTAPPWRILEIGCGTGALIRNLAGLTSAEISFFGLDIDPEALRFARARSPLSPVCAAGEFLPFPADSFDLVCCHYLLLWAPDPPVILREMRRCSKPQGLTAVLAEPDYAGRVDWPAAAREAGREQTAALTKQGIDSLAGRKLFGWMRSAGFAKPVFGLHGIERTFEEQSMFLMEESLQCTEDVVSIPSSWTMSDEQTALPEMIVVPTFFSYAVKEDSFRYQKKY